jgi:signal transduction histidine kinase
VLHTIDCPARLCHNQIMRLYHFNFILVLCTAAVVLAAGIWLARREVRERLPVDRSLVRECAMELNGEIARLDNIYLADLRQLAAVGVSATNAAGREALKESCSLLSGICQCSFFYKKSGRDPKHTVKVDVPLGMIMPQVFLQAPDERPFFQNNLALNRALLFPPSANPSQNEGWVLPPGGRFALFWSRLDEDSVLAFTLDMREIGRIADSYLLPKIAAWYAPVRAAGEVYRLEGPEGNRLAGLEKAPAREPDFIVPLPAHIGTWQFLSWDTYKIKTVHDPVRLAVAGTLVAVLFAVGLILFLQQRRAHRTAEQRVSFVNRVSHELGTPLTNMLLNLELGIEALDENPREARHRLDIVSEETQRLARLVRNVLTFSRRERGKLKVNPAPCVPDDVIDDVLRQFSPALQRAGIETERKLSASATVQCDIDALAQIMANLVSNVEKYAAAGKWLGIESNLNNGFMSVKVSDRGPGIPVKAREIIFRPFERVDDAVQGGATGTGLGLAIARDLAQLMGGTLYLLEAEEGAVFELKIPVKKE